MATFFGGFFVVSCGGVDSQVNRDGPRVVGDGI